MRLRRVLGERSQCPPLQKMYSHVYFSNSGLNAHTLFRGDLPSPWLSWGFLQLEELVLSLSAPRASWPGHRVSQLHSGPCSLVADCPACLFSPPLATHTCACRGGGGMGPGAARL